MLHLRIDSILSRVSAPPVVRSIAYGIVRMSCFSWNHEKILATNLSIAFARSATSRLLQKSRPALDNFVTPKNRRWPHPPIRN